MMELESGWEVIAENEEKFIVPVTKEARVQYFLDEAKLASVKNDLYACKSWLLTGIATFPDSFELQFELYKLEKKGKNLPEVAWHFESLYRQFPGKMHDEVREVSEAVRMLHMTTISQSAEQEFLNQIFASLPKSFQMEVLLRRSEMTDVQYEKCQAMLLLVKLFPDMIGQHGADLLFSLLGCESEVNSIFRKLLVTELIPAVLSAKKDWASAETSHLYQILNLCIEYYVMTPSADNENMSWNSDKSRWPTLFNIIDQIGRLLKWGLVPLLTDYRGKTIGDSIYQRLTNHDSQGFGPNELGYIIATLFLYCITSCWEVRDVREGDELKFALVEVFVPGPSGYQKLDPKGPVKLTVSNCSTVDVVELNQLKSNFQLATKLWERITTSKEGKEVFSVLDSLKSLKLDQWVVFQQFSLDYRTYAGQKFTPESVVSKNPIELASFHCASRNYKAAAENALNAVQGIAEVENGNAKGVKATEDGDIEMNDFISSDKEDFRFFNFDTESLKCKIDTSVLAQRRVHFISDNPSEIITYAAHVLIKGLYDILEDSAVVDDSCLGHLMTLIQLEWASPPAQAIFSKILSIIKERGSFRYLPYFSDYIVEPDFLEQFMYFSRHEGKKIKLDIWNSSPQSVIVGSSRRMATRGVDKGAKNDFLVSMKRQMLKAGQLSLEKLISTFMIESKAELLSCFS